MTFLASSCPNTYSSRNFLISRGLISLKFGRVPDSTLFFFSSERIWFACVTHLSQMCAWIPEIIRSTSFLLLPQNEHVTSAIAFFEKTCPAKRQRYQKTRGALSLPDASQRPNCGCQSAVTGPKIHFFLSSTSSIRPYSFASTDFIQ